MSVKSTIPGTGWVEDLPSGNFRGRYLDPVTGKKPGKSWPSWDEANAWQIERRLDVHSLYTDAGVELRTLQRGVPLFEAFATEWVKTHPTNSAATRRTYGSHVRALNVHLGDKRVDRIEENHVLVMMGAWREAGLSSGTIAARLVVFRQIMKAVHRKYKTEDPSASISAPPSGRKPDRILSEQEVCLLLAFMPHWLWPAVLLAFDCGLRLGEVLGLRVLRLDLDGAMVEVADVLEENGNLRNYPKGKVAETIPLTPRVVAALRGHLVDFPAGRMETVFRDPKTGGPVGHAQLKYQFYKARKAAGLDDPQPTFHDLRHSCATRLARRGVPATIIQMILRHKNLATTQRYIERAAQTDQAAWMRFAFEGGESPLPVAA
ncbi:site-specific integrase [Allokutzneria sp. A3M-2-11 16]|uniref:tyrosine-type recombinase/integrase n=1 Tax=Allokutzneria sp. A3M-2-11 16 TaxID=2962043 RepID=UPI0020B8BEC1|nr:tyrosine-type recombinase/integrase [Allokutzneria sp. A3M-2-11 16]MCP3801832.1 site-specific integrase [Allokutzneria sp. A3M-2-11 16]